MHLQHLRTEAASQALYDAINGQTGEDILRNYTRLKEGDDGLMENHGDRQDLVADLIADLKHSEALIDKLVGSVPLFEALQAFCDQNGYDFPNLRRRGTWNAEAEMDEAAN